MTMQQKILKILENDARLSAKQISEIAGIPATEVSKLVKKAEKDPIYRRVTTYCANLSPAKVVLLGIRADYYIGNGRAAFRYIGR